MAFCPECGTVISAEAMSCPKCGKPLGGASIKKVSTGTKKKSTAAIFAFLFGSLGVHRFYLGEKSKGMFRLCIQIFIVILSIASIAVEESIFESISTIFNVANYCWALFDGVTIIKMSDTVFEEKYNT